jgi:HEAT repeat protein
MPSRPFEDLLRQLESSEAGSIAAAVEAIGARFSSLSAAEHRRAVQAICALFYVDLYDRQDLQPAVDAAEKVLAGAGEPVIPILIGLMEGSDIKSHLHLARVLAAIGPPALPHLRRLVATAEDPYVRSFALYAIGKFKDEMAHEALPEAVGALMHPDKEIRDSAARTLGKILEVVPPDRLTVRRRSEIYEALCRVTGDDQPAVRAKAVRSLGKMAVLGFLDAVQRRDLGLRLEALLTRGEGRDWDHAYIVRREANEALGHLRQDKPRT